MNKNRLDEEMDKAQVVYEDNIGKSSEESTQAYNDFLDWFLTVDFNLLCNDKLLKAIDDLHALVTELSISTEPASDDNPVDYTAKILNADFSYDAEGWTNEDWMTFENNSKSWKLSANEEGAISDDKLYLNLWNEGSTAYGYQDVTQLPAGPTRSPSVPMPTMMACRFLSMRTLLTFLPVSTRKAATCASIASTSS